MRTEKDIEKDIRLLTKQYENKQIEKKEFLTSQLELMKESLTLPLTPVKKAYIKQGIKLLEMTNRLLK